MKILIILNEGPYSNEKSYNGLRTGIQLLNQVKDVQVSYFLFADAISSIMQNQKPSATKYNAGKLIEELINKGATIKICKSCMEARGSISLIEGVEISNMVEYADLIINADKIITF
nr:DsrE family protein [uncultured Flavobacterium sp.]